jgi:hypothetical protein
MDFTYLKYGIKIDFRIIKNRYCVRDQSGLLFLASRAGSASLGKEREVVMMSPQPGSLGTCVKRP